MIIGSFAVSVQFGQGHHYFSWTGNDEGAAQAVYEQQCLWAKNYKKKGAKPHVFLWGLKAASKQPPVIPS